MNKYKNGRYSEEEMINDIFPKLCEKYSTNRPLSVIDPIKRICRDEKEIGISEITEIQSLIGLRIQGEETQYEQGVVNNK